MAGRDSRMIWVVLTVAALVMSVAAPQAWADPTGHGTTKQAAGHRPLTLLKSPKVVRPTPSVPKGRGASSAFPHPLPTPVSEIVPDRTADSSTWRDSDGSLTVRKFVTPHFYRRSTGWAPIDTKLSPVEGQPGHWLSGPNAWRATFGPADDRNGAEQITVDGHRIGFEPKAVSKPVQAPSVSGSTAKYVGLWRQADLTEQVTASGVTEDIVLNSASAPSSYAFGLSGATAKANNAGGLSLRAGGE